MSQIQSGGEPFLIRGDSGIGVLLVHGWTSAPQEMLELGKHLAGQDHTVLGLRLPGHATRPADLNRMRWRDWLAAVEDGYCLLDSACEQVVAMGLSLGGALALLLACSRPVAGVVAMATPYKVPTQPGLRWLGTLLLTLRPISSVLRFVPKPSVNDYKDQQAYRDHLSYKVFPIRSVPEVSGLLELLREQLPRLRAPVLLMHAAEDRGVSPDHARSIYAQLGSIKKDLVWIENSGHVITVEPGRKRVYDLATSFVDRITKRVR
ncbi:MAG: alpha/beta fold hydrolase [Chloroflexi bacterium]|nr:alpha/beta fold hydrolase [Chloroflexota bacterium]